MSSHRQNPSFNLSIDPDGESNSPWRRFSAQEWEKLREKTPLPLSEAELSALRGRGETVSLDEVKQIYLPLSRFLNLHVRAARILYRATSEFLGKRETKTPYIIGLAGSVAVGKSTTARILRELLARWPNHPKVEIVATDGFLLPNAELEARGLMRRKGWPESFDQAQLLRFVAEIKSGAQSVSAPCYSHSSYDIVPDQKITIDQPDIIILEGLNVLQMPSPPARDSSTSAVVSDFFDFSIYLDADPSALRQWYIARFFELRQTAFRDPKNYFHRYACIDEKDILQIAGDFWDGINLPNLIANILPTRPRADLILRKNVNHAISEVWFRKL